jgi:hypothetical protein
MDTKYFFAIAFVLVVVVSYLGFDKYKGNLNQDLALAITEMQSAEPAFRIAAGYDRRYVMENPSFAAYLNTKTSSMSLESQDWTGMEFQYFLTYDQGTNQHFNNFYDYDAVKELADTTVKAIKNWKVPNGRKEQKIYFDKVKWTLLNIMSVCKMNIGYLEQRLYGPNRVYYETVKFGNKAASEELKSLLTRLKEKHNSVIDKFVKRTTEVSNLADFFETSHGLVIELGGEISEMNDLLLVWGDIIGDNKLTAQAASVSHFRLANKQDPAITASADEKTKILGLEFNLKIEAITLLANAVKATAKYVKDAKAHNVKMLGFEIVSYRID